MSNIWTQSDTKAEPVPHAGLQPQLPWWALPALYPETSVVNVLSQEMLPQELHVGLERHGASKEIDDYENILL